MDKFEQMAKAEGKTGVRAASLWFFLSQTKKWWLLPMVIILLGFGVLVALSGTAAAPFIYTLF